MATVQPADEDEHQTASENAAPRPVCGIIRPIAAMADGYTQEHWLDVHSIVDKAVKDAGYQLRLVSEGGAGIIVADIIDNIYNDPLIICDVSGRNPNVMFELGMRVTFEKPVIIIKDDATPFSFDITPIKHIVYRRDLRMPAMLTFQAELTDAIVSTMKASKDENYRHYLQQFGPVDVTKLGNRQIDMASLVEGLDEMRRAVGAINAKLSVRSQPLYASPSAAAMASTAAQAASASSAVSTYSASGHFDFTIQMQRSKENDVNDAIARLNLNIHPVGREGGEMRKQLVYRAYLTPLLSAQDILSAVTRAIVAVDPTARIV